MSITVYGYPNTRALRVTWILEELGLDYRYELVDLMKGEARSAAYLELNPSGKLPALKVDSGVITESLAIVNYLCNLCPESELVPTLSPFRRARYDQWTLFAMTELEQPMWTISKHKFALPSEYRVKEVIPTAEYEFQRALTIFSDGLGDQDYILGEQFTAADIMLGHSLFWAMSFGQVMEQQNVKDYIGRIGVRPALSAAREREKAALAS